MKRKNKGLRLLTALLLFLFAALSLAGCSSVRSTDIEHLVGVSIADTDIRWREVLQEELVRYSQDLEHTRFIFRNARGSVSKQKEDISLLQEDGVDLLIVTPVDEIQMSQTIAKVYESIPVIVMDRGVEGFDYTEFIGPDNVLVGEQGAELVEEILRSPKPDGVMEFCEYSDISDVRSRAFEQNLSGAGHYSRRVRLTSATSDAAEDKLLKNPEYLSGIGVIFAHSDTIARGVLRGLKELKRTDIDIVCVDDSGDDENLQLLKDGDYAALIQCPTGGLEAIQSATSLLVDGQQLPQKLILRSTPVMSGEEEKASYGKKASSGSSIRMGYVQIQEDTAFRAASTSSIRSAAKEADIDLTMAFPQPDIVSQTAQVRSFIREGMDVIAISPIVSYGWDEVLREARDAGIPVIICDREVDAPIDLYAGFVGADYLEEGRKCGSWLADTLTGTGEVRILELLGTEGSSPARDRQAGFEQQISGDSNFSVCARLQANFSRKEGQDQVAAYLEEHGLDFGVIFAHNDDMALGAADALSAFGAAPGRDVIILSVDGTKDALKAVQKGKLNAVAECSPLLGPLIMTEAVNYLNGNPSALKTLVCEQFFTQENVDRAVLSARAY